MSRIRTLAVSFNSDDILKEIRDAIVCNDVTKVKKVKLLGMIKALKIYQVNKKGSYLF